MKSTFRLLDTVTAKRTATPRIAAMCCVLLSASACVSSTGAPATQGLATLQGQPLARATSLLGEPTGEIRIGGRHTVYWQKSYAEHYAAPSVIRTVSGNSDQRASEETESLKLKTRNHTCTVKLSLDKDQIISNAVMDGDPAACNTLVKPIA